MNLRDYIDSGVIERFLLGLATTEQEQELAYLRQQFPILEQEIAAVELKIERKLLEEAVDPPYALKDEVMQSIHRNYSGGKHYRTYSTKTRPPRNDEPEYIHVKPGGWNRRIEVSIWWRCAFIAVCVLAMSLAASTWYFHQRTEKLEDILIRLKTPAIPAVQSVIPG
ncbi:hypothetical protein ECE50_022365 [Chitinophaga sp. Mgbs1]|uniref:Uncharacterized protein n=1 Tax=Chitinophaga solisilvae TaxID=1233460 RepID=A0A9Q5GSE9_9BACT|nr:hypothetical protein [Chitinophaga solisilvae]